MLTSAVPSSFRDPHGFLFLRDGVLYRQIQTSYRPHYEKAQSSGLFKTLNTAGSLIRHEEVPVEPLIPGAYKILRPEVIPFISYPYEWSFSQFKNAALLTLEIQRQALSKGMILKDASAYNIQFKGAKPVLIDTLSFEIYEEGKPWIAYRQFCEHFLAPLALMSFSDARLGSLLLSHPDGIPLDMASRILPWSTWFSPSLLLNIHLQAKLQFQSHSEKLSSRKTFSLNDLSRLIGHLESAVLKLKNGSRRTLWKDYQKSESYTPEGIQAKKNTVSEFISKVTFRHAWDLGAHAGDFSSLLASKADFVLALDGDPAAVETHYLKNVGTAEERVLPLVMDLTHPSPSLGWETKERLSLEERGPADLILMLAVLHHLAISNNVPLQRIAAWLAKLTRYLIIEFVPKEDPKTQELLSRREDIFPEYTQSAFENAFTRHFRILAQKPLTPSLRTLYLLEKI